MDLKPDEVFNLVAHIERQRAWSRRTFGEDNRVEGLCKHIESELGEIRRAPEDLYEWIDVIILAIDGAWRQGYSPKDIAFALGAKQERNEARQWPKPETLSNDAPAFHIKDSPADGITPEDLEGL
jgi:hypothetical protein